MNVSKAKVLYVDLNNVQYRKISATLELTEEYLIDKSGSLFPNLNIRIKLACRGFRIIFKSRMTLYLTKRTFEQCRCNN